MPFIYHDKEIIKEGSIREFSKIGLLVREAIYEVEDWDPFKDVKGFHLKSGKLLYLLNTDTDHPPRDKADPHKFFVLSCLTKGLNWREIEMWLDSSFLNNKGEFHFDKSSILNIDERRIWYKTPRGAAYGGLPCTHLEQYFEY